MSSNQILFRTPATAVDGELVEPGHVQFSLNAELLDAWQEQCKLFETRQWLQSMRSDSLPSDLDWDGLGPLNACSQLCFLRSPNSSSTILVELSTSHDDESIVSMAVPIDALCHLRKQAIAYGWARVAYDPDEYADLGDWAENDFGIQVVHFGEWLSDDYGTSEAREVIGQDSFGQFYGAMELSIGGGDGRLYWSEPMPSIEAAKEVASKRVTDWTLEPIEAETTPDRPRC